MKRCSCFFPAGDRAPSSAHDHVILPKHVTDRFYATLTQCYEELFNASLTPKYTLKSERKPAVERLSSPQAAPSMNAYIQPAPVALRRHRQSSKRDPTSRYSLDVSSLASKQPTRTRKLSDPELFKEESDSYSHSLKQKEFATNSVGAESASKLSNPFSTRKKTYRLSQKTSMTSVV